MFFYYQVAEQTVFIELLAETPEEQHKLENLCTECGLLSPPYMRKGRLGLDDRRLLLLLFTLLVFITQEEHREPLAS